MYNAALTIGDNFTIAIYELRADGWLEKFLRGNRFLRMAKSLRICENRLSSDVHEIFALGETIGDVNFFRDNRQRGVSLLSNRELIRL